MQIDVEMAFDGRLDTAYAFACRDVFSVLPKRVSLAHTAQDACGNAQRWKGKSFLIPSDDVSLGRYAWRR